MVRSLWFPPARREEPELLDSPAQYPEELGPSLAEVRGVNRWLGGTRVALRFLSSRPELAPGATANLLDVGTGTADIPLALAGWARGQGLDLTITATDLSAEVLAHARGHVAGRGDIRLEIADATRLPYADASYDFVLCNLALHHFPPRQAVLVLREMYRVARRAILINDLQRSRPAYWGARLLFGLVTRDPMTSHDGPLSVLRSYTVSELRELAEEAGLRRYTVRSRPLFRLELLAEKGA
ncbi:MAG: methyltransferase domain-containing protein [Chloroflexota bacterium]|nr:methyltransferase domain-containing protein [Chloroflexota bacterium]